MHGHDRLLAAFLAGDLDRAAAREWDEHLLECEQCWRAVREDRAGRQAAGLLRQPAPDGLADRVAFAVELAAVGAAAPHLPRRTVRLRRSWLAATGAFAVGLAVTLLVLLVPGGRTGMPVLRRLRAGQHRYQEGVVWAFLPAMSVSKGDSLGREGCSKLFSLVSDLLRGLT